MFIIDFFVDDLVIWEYRINRQKYFTLFTLRATFPAVCLSCNVKVSFLSGTYTFP